MFVSRRIDIVRFGPVQDNYKFASATKAAHVRMQSKQKANAQERFCKREEKITMHAILNMFQR